MIERGALEPNFHRNRPLETRAWIAIVMPVLFTAVTLGHSYGQILHPAGRAPSFEVATIKPSSPDPVGRRSIGPKGDDRFVTRNATVKALIEFAYTTDSDRQIVGLSGWTNSDGYDIDAKVGDAEVAEILRLPPMRRMDPYRLMQQSLLADRFNLKVHFETRELPAYALVVAKGGPKMRTTEMNPANPAETLKPRSLRMVRPGDAAGAGVTTAMLAELLERQTELGGGNGRTVVDKTNLSGMYDWTLRWTPWHDAPDEAPLDSSGPSLFTALQEQLGLKLEPTKAQVDVIVIDHIERPSAN
jgi:uncharacterized protein (TIGR03435 family)